MKKGVLTEKTSTGMRKKERIRIRDCRKPLISRGTGPTESGCGRRRKNKTYKSVYISLFGFDYNLCIFKD